jgi:hypothetical protein
MGRPLTILILAIAVACAALFLLLPMSKIAQHRDQVAAQPASVPALDRAIEAATAANPEVTGNDIDASDPGAQVAPEENTLPVNGHVGNASGAALAGVEIEIESKGLGGDDIATAREVSDRMGAFDCNWCRNASTACTFQQPVTMPGTASTLLPTKTPSDCATSYSSASNWSTSTA